MARDTQLAAYAAIKPKAASMRALILDLLQDEPMTCNEVERITGYRQSSANGRISELARDGLIRDSGERRLTDAGRKAIVWEVA